MQVDENRGALAILVVTLCVVAVLVWLSSRDHGSINAPPGSESYAQHDGEKESEQKPAKAGTKSESGPEGDGKSAAETEAHPAPAPKANGKSAPDAKPAPAHKADTKSAPEMKPATRSASEPKAETAAKQKAPSEALKRARTEAEYEKQIQGTWQQFLEKPGQKAGSAAGVNWTFQAGIMIAQIDGKEAARWAYTIDGTRSPPHLDFYTTDNQLVPQGSALTLGVFGLAGDDLTVAFTYAITGSDGRPLVRPTTLATAPTTPHRMLFKRAVGGSTPDAPVKTAGP